MFDIHLSPEQVRQLTRVVDGEKSRMAGKVKYYLGPQVDRTLPTYEQERQAVENSLQTLKALRAKLALATSDTGILTLDEAEIAALRLVLRRARKGERRRAAVYDSEYGKSISNYADIDATIARNEADGWDHLLQQLPTIEGSYSEAFDLRSRKSLHSAKNCGQKGGSDQV